MSRAHSKNPATYFGTTDGFPPGDPGGGITGVVAAPRPEGCTVIPGSTFGGAMVPFCLDRRSLIVSLPAGGAIRSGGGDGAFGGAIGTVGFVGEVGCGFCASAGVAAMVSAISKESRGMNSVSVRFQALNAPLPD
jgi:hypothetical protein